MKFYDIEFGAVPFGDVEKTAGRTIKIQDIEKPETVFVAVFPYFAGNENGNIAKYARGKDYHTVVRGLLQSAVRQMEKEYPQSSFKELCDMSPLPEVAVAAMAGLGIIGRSGLLITPDYGSYVFIGTIVSDVKIETRSRGVSFCCSCGACVRACPTGVLSDGFMREKCLSDVTQRRGALSEREQNLIKTNNRVFGCDACADACPHNFNARRTWINEFRENLTYNLYEGDVSGLSDKKLREKYPEKAFTWRGAAVLKRNCALCNASALAKHNEL